MNRNREVNVLNYRLLVLEPLALERFRTIELQSSLVDNRDEDVW
jgi:hypothetical protein